MALQEDKNYVKLAQVYNVLRIHYVDDYFDDANVRKKLYIKAIVENDFDINYKLPSTCFICQSKPDYAGNTALHFIMEFYDDNLIDIFDVLIERGVDLTIQNDGGYTPLLLAFLKDKNINEILHRYFTVKNFENIHCKNGMSHFHVACSTNLTEIIDCYLKTGVSVNERVNDDSPNFAGYTPLHFAMQYCQPQTILLLLNNGASLQIKDSKMMTPLHVLIQSLLQKTALDDEMQKFLQDAISKNLFDLPDDTGLNYTHLSCILGSLKEIPDIDTPVNLDSPICAGYTPLHFAAHFHFETVILVLKAGANLLAKDIKGTTPFDLCFKKFNLSKIIQILLEEKQHHLSLKLKFTNGTSVVDALIAMKNYDQFEEFLEKKFENKNTLVSLESPIWPGCSLIYLAEILIGYCYGRWNEASFAVQDANGMTFLHIAFRLMKDRLVTQMFRENHCIRFNPISFANLVDRDNLSPLHIACAVQELDVVKNFLISGANPNLSTLCDFQWIVHNYYRYLIKTGSTPLSIILIIRGNRCTKDIIDALLQHGANPYIVDANGETPYHIALKNEQNEYFKLMLKSDPAFDRENVHEKLGLTKLQIACFIQDLSMLKKELESGADVNQCIASDSPICPGDTAFHLLYRGESLVKRSEFAELLLAHGADPSLQNSTNLTPIDLMKEEIFELHTFLETNDFYLKNPINTKGQSYFHMSCMKNRLFAAENFIKSGINVNIPIDHFDDSEAGYTPLHCAVDYNNEKIIELLLNSGADPNIKAANGYTPLHLAVLDDCSYESFQILLRCPTLDIQATNILGDTALEMAIRMTDPESLNLKLKLLLDRGACINFKRLIYNRIHPLIVQAVYKIDLENFERLIIKTDDLTISDENGQNLIHHINSRDISYCDFCTIFNNISFLNYRGCDIDHKNNQGKTALHLVTISRNKLMVRVLLALGADINIKDDDKKKPYAYAKKKCKKEFIKYMRKLEAAGFYTDEFDDLDSFDRDSFNSSSEEDDFLPSDVEDFFATPKKQEKKEYNSQLKKINPIFSTAYIFSEQFLKDHLRISMSQRKAIFNLCKPFESLIYFLKIQLRRAHTRKRLLDPAANSFQALTGFALFETCLDIVDYLNNDDLMNLVRAANETLEYIPILFEDDSIKKIESSLD